QAAQQRNTRKPLPPRVAQALEQSRETNQAQRRPRSLRGRRRRCSQASASEEPGEKDPEQGDFHVHPFPSWRNGNRPRGTSATCKVQATSVTMRPEKRRFARKRRQARRAIDTPATRQECW